MSTVSQLKTLVYSFKGKSIDNFTHAMKELGNGNMVDGVGRIINVCENSIRKAKIHYGLGGIAIGSAGVGIPWLISKRKQESDKQNNKDEAEILSVLKKELELTDEEKDLDNLSTEDKDK